MNVRVIYRKWLYRK